MASKGNSASKITHAKPRQSDAVKKQTVIGRGARSSGEFGAAQSPKSGPKVTTRKPKSTG